MKKNLCLCLLLLIIFNFCNEQTIQESKSESAATPVATTQYLLITSFTYGNNATLYLFRKSSSDCSITEVNNYAVGNNAFDLYYDSKGFVYVSNEGAASISVFQLNKTNESLTAVGSPVTQVAPATSLPYGIAVHEAGFMYIADGNNNGSIGIFQQNSTTGGITQIAPNYVSTGTSNRVWFTALFKNTNFLYATMYDNARVNLYVVNPSTGALTAHSTPFVNSGNNPWEVVFHPTGKYLYVANYGSASVSQYSVNSNTGELTSIATAVAAGTNPISLAVGTHFLFAGSFNNGNAGGVYSYSIDQNSGALSATAQGSIALPAPGVYGMALDKNNECLYVARSDYNANNDGEDIRIFSVNTSTGFLTTAGSKSAGSGPRFIKVAY